MILEYEEKDQNSHCFWCNAENLILRDVDECKPIKKYFDSPVSTMQLNETLSENLQQLLKTSNPKKIGVQFQTQIIEKRLKQLKIMKNHKSMTDDISKLQQQQLLQQEQQQYLTENVKSYENFELTEEEELQLSKHFPENRFNKYIFQGSRFAIRIGNDDRSTIENEKNSQFESDSLNDRSVGAFGIYEYSFCEMQQVFQEPNVQQSQLILQNSSINQ